MSVAQPVEDQFDEFSSRRDDADVAPAAGADVVAELSQAAMGAGTLDGFDRGPAHQFAALFGDPTAVDRGVGFVVFWSQPGPAGQLRGSTKAVTSPISATNTAARTGPTPEIAWIAT